VNIDVTFDYRTDSNRKDPDLHSPTLRNHHQLLWSKPLPNGHVLKLEKKPGHYLFHSSDIGDFSLSSDTISNSQRARKSMKRVLESIPSSDLDSFQSLGSTVGARLVFPGKKIDNKLTINVARGLNSQIADRFDLTLECIRLQYLGAINPLQSTLNTYWSFFELFNDFEGYVKFFLLEDLVENQKIEFFLPFTSDFSNPALPTTPEEYIIYRENTMNFVTARNERIATWSASSFSGD
jgi:hypothetical protein